ncbi:MAG: hypothetical protein ACE5EA_09220 [Nitrospirota bacterium]
MKIEMREKNKILILIISFLLIFLCPSFVSSESISDINIEWLKEKININSGRDPFDLPVEKENFPEIEVTEPEAKPEIKISGIIYSKDKGIVIIDNQILRKGDTFKGIKIIDILDDRVIIRDKDGKREIKVNKLKIIIKGQRP